jgi:hypothetical protein
MSKNLEEAGTWYYVVDCATCKEPVPFKYAPEGEPIACFPTMTVRCFHCHSDHTYPPDLISHRKVAPPRGIFNGDRQPSRVDDGNREAARDVISDRKTAPISASLRRNNILNVAVRGKRATIFFFSSCFFAAAWLSQVALSTFYAAPVAALNEVRSSGPAMLLGTMFFGTVFLGFVLFIFGLGSAFVEAFDFKGKLIRCRFAAVHAATTAAVFLTEMRQRKFRPRELLRAWAGRAWHGAAARTKTSRAKHDFEPSPFIADPGGRCAPDQ